MPWKDYWRMYSGMDYKLILLILLSIVVLVSGFYYISIKEVVEEQPTNVTQPVEEIKPAPSTGTLIVLVKDRQYKLPGLGTVTALNLTIKTVEVHSAANETGWITVFNGTKSFDLLVYTDVRAIIGEKELVSGKYTQIRLGMVDGSIKIYNIDMNVFNKTYTLLVPSKELKLNHPFTIEENKTLALVLDFDVEKSVTRTADGYTLKSVIGILEEKLEKGEKPANSREV